MLFRSVAACSCSLKINIPSVYTAVRNMEIRCDKRKETGVRHEVKASLFKKGDSARGVN